MVALPTRPSLPTIEKNIRFKVIILAELCGASNYHKRLL